MRMLSLRLLTAMCASSRQGSGIPLSDTTAEKGYRTKKRILGKLKEKKKKNDLRWKLANIIVRAAKEKQYAIVMEDLGDKPAKARWKPAPLGSTAIHNPTQI